LREGIFKKKTFRDYIGVGKKIKFTFFFKNGLGNVDDLNNSSSGASGIFGVSNDFAVCGSLESLLSPGGETSLECSSNASMLSRMKRPSGFCALDSEVDESVGSDSGGPGAGNGSLSFGGSGDLFSCACEASDSESGVLFGASSGSGDCESSWL